MNKSLVVAAIVALSCSTANGAEVIVHTMSVHFTPNERQNNANFGVGYLADKPCFESERFKNNMIGGVYHNTYSRVSVYGGCYVALADYNDKVELGVMAGVVTGYEHAITPAALVIGTYRITDKWNVKASFAPIANGVANLSFGYRF